MKKNIAVVGCGYWGKNLVRNFADLGSLYAVCDPDTEVANNFSKKYKVQNLSFKEIINDSNIVGVVLAVPATLHASFAIDAMKALKNVYVEKPLAMNEIEAMQMIAVAKEKNVNLMVGHLLQYHPIFRAVRNLVVSGQLGNLNYLYSNRLSLGKIRTEEDIIWSFAPHDISMILSLANEELETVNTESTSILQDNIADIAQIHMQFNSGLKAHVSVSWLNPYKEQKLVVIGEKMTVVFDDVKPWNEKIAVYKHKVEFKDKKPIVLKADVEYLDIPEAEPLKEECKYFVDLINGDVPPLTDGEEGMRVLKVLSAASISKEKNIKVIMNANSAIKDI